MQKFIYLIFLLLSVIYTRSEAQVFQYIGIADGLSSRRVLSIQQGEYDYIFLMQLFDQPVDGKLRPFQPARLKILSQHTVRHIYGQHHLDSRMGHLLQFGAELWPSQPHYDECERRREEQEFGPDPLRRKLGHQRFKGFEITETLHRPPPHPNRQQIDTDQNRQ